MSFALPQVWRLAADLVVTKCETNPVGGTDVECAVYGVPLKPFSFADYDVARQGLDQLVNRIEACATEQIADALRLAR